MLDAWIKLYGFLNQVLSISNRACYDGHLLMLETWRGIFWFFFFVSFGLGAIITNMVDDYHDG